MSDNMDWERMVRDERARAFEYANLIADVRDVVFDHVDRESDFYNRWLGAVCASPASIVPMVKELLEGLDTGSCMKTVPQRVPWPYQYFAKPPSKEQYSPLVRATAFHHFLELLTAHMSF